MSDVKKTIQITPELFKVTGEKSRAKKSKTQKNRPKQQSNPLKKELMSKIKEHAKRNKQTFKEGKEFTTNFDEHMEYLNILSQKRKLKVHTSLPNELQKNEQRQPDNTTKVTIKPLSKLEEVPLNSFNDTVASSQPIEHQPLSHPVAVPPPPVAVASHPVAVASPIPHTRVQNDPSYGILKRGNKPTYRQWHRNKTLRSRPPISKPKELVQEVKSTYKLGKSKKKRKVSIFLKNKKTRRKIQDEMNSLKRKSIEEVKEYLRKHNIIKAGSTAPHDVLRQLYQQTHLAGEIRNNSNENVIHNYLAESDDEEATH